MALPQGHEKSDEIDSKPSISSRLMVDSSLVPSHTFEPEMMGSVEIEFGDGKNFRPTKVYQKLPVLANGEELLWSYVKTEGIFNKKVEFVMALTNFRALIYDFKNPSDSGHVFLTPVDDILVMNTRRVSHSVRTGSFNSTGRYGMRVGTNVGSGTSSSQTVGDVVFMKGGEKFVVFGDMSDPHGIAGLAKSVKKIVIVRDKALVEDSTASNEIILELIELDKQGNIKEFVKLCTKELEKNPDEFIFGQKIAKLMELKDWEEMETSARKMISVKHHQVAFEYLCTALFKLDKIEEAIKELNASLKLFPDSDILLGYKEQVASFEANLSYTKSITCPKCKKENDVDSKFCNTCGSKMNEGCVECGHVNPKDVKFCNSCGYTLK